MLAELNDQILELQSQLRVSVLTINELSSANALLKKEVRQGRCGHQHWIGRRCDACGWSVEKIG